MAVPALRPAHVRVNYLLRHVALEADALPAAALSSTLPVLRAAQQELKQGISKWLRDQKGSDRFTVYKYRNALVQVRGAMERIKETTPTLYQGMVEADGKAAPLAVRHVRRQLTELSEIFGEDLRPIRLDLAAVIADGEKTLMRRFARSAERYPGDAGNFIRHQLAVGVVRGESVDEAMRRLVTRRFSAPVVNTVLGSIENTAAMAAESLFSTTNYWAERLVRTEVMNAYNVRAESAVRYVAQFDPEIRQQWNAALDYRVCVDCRSLHGAIAKVGEKFTGNVEAPPLHPNCRCIVTAWRKDWDSPATPKEATGNTSSHPGYHFVNGLKAQGPAPSGPVTETAKKWGPGIGNVKAGRLEQPLRAALTQAKEDDKGVDRLLEKFPLKELSATKRSAARWNGRYTIGGPDLHTLEMNFARDLTPGAKAFEYGKSWTVSESKTKVEHHAATMTHELGHHMHMSLKSVGDQQGLDLHLEAAKFHKVKTKAPSEYARSNHMEWFAETHSVYVYHPNALQQNAPEAYDYMKRVRKFLGMD